jgi:predicted CoA-binding protein
MGLTTVVIGASPNTERYSYIATERLKKHGHPVFPVGLRSGNIGDMPILTGQPEIQNVDTVTLYVGPTNLLAWQDYILRMHPRRIIFNPGTEHSQFIELASSKGIECVDACTLVLLSTGEY